MKKNVYKKQYLDRICFCGIHWITFHPTGVFFNFISFKNSNIFDLWKTCLSHGMAVPSVVPRQTSPLGLQVKLPTTANAAQADPTSPRAASLLSCLGTLSWGWEAGAGKPL